MGPTLSAALQHDDASSGRAGTRAETASAHLRPVPNACTFSLVSTRAEFDALKDDWNRLFDRASTSAQLFQSFGWCWHWCNSFLPSDDTGKHGANGATELAILVGRRNGELVTVWPLVTERHGGLTHLVWLGAPVSQYGDILIDDLPDAAEIIRAGWQHLLQSRRTDLIWLSKVRADAAIAPLFKQQNGTVTRCEQAPFMDLASAPDFDTYMLRHSARARKKHRAVARKLAAMGKVEFVRQRQTPRAGALALEAIHEKIGQLLERGIVSPALSDPRTQKFFAEAAVDTTNPAGICVFALEINGESAAIDVLVKHKDRVATHIFAYNPKYAKDRVGAHLMELTIEQSLLSGFRYFDMLPPADDYKTRWSDGAIDVIDWAMPLTIKGTLYTHAYLRALRPALKRARDWMPPSVAKVVSSGYQRMHRLTILLSGAVLPPAT